MTSSTSASEQVYLKLKNVWKAFWYDAQEEELNIDLISKYPFLNYFEENNIGYAILDTKNYRLIYRNNYFYNLMGVSKEEFDNYGDAFVLANFASYLPQYNALIVKYLEQVWSRLKLNNKKDIKSCVSGLHYNHPQKGTRRLFMQSYVLATDINQYPIYNLILYYDITYLLKNDFYWFKIYCESEKNKSVVYHSETNEILKGDIITTREKEILEFIVSGKTSEEIAEMLYISKITVNNHRQNMLNRLGVKDTTALVELVNLAQIL